MRVVIDTNVLLVILPSPSKYHRILQKLKDGEVILIVNFDILLEYEKLLKSD
ncbi:MAG: PIN domain-containing protein [Flavobacterium sp.]|nr:PIN domain-containing protein [Flavobacterium sp.]